MGLLGEAKEEGELKILPSSKMQVSTEKITPVLRLLKIFHTVQLIYKCELRSMTEEKKTLDEYLGEGIRLALRRLELRMSQLPWSTG